MHQLIAQELVRHLSYDVDVNLRDVPFLASPLHVEFIRALLDWTRAAWLTVDSGESGGDAQLGTCPESTRKLRLFSPRAGECQD